MSYVNILVNRVHWVYVNINIMMFALYEINAWPNQTLSMSWAHLICLLALEAWGVQGLLQYIYLYNIMVYITDSDVIFHYAYDYQGYGNSD